MIYFSHITNPFQPNKGRRDRVLDEGKTVWQLVEEQKVDLKRPTICMINGVAVLRKFGRTLLSRIRLFALSHFPRAVVAVNPQTRSRLF